MKTKKLVVLAAAIAIPIGGLASATALSAGTAWAQGSYICSITGLGTAPTSNVVFPGPGVTVAGSVSESTISSTRTTTAVLPSGPSCGVGGSIAALTITAINPPCSATTTPPAGPVCTIDVGAGDWAYGSWNSFVATGASSLVTGLPHPKFKIDTDTFVGTTTGASAGVGAPCTPTEVGFNIIGTVAPLEGYSTFSMTDCLDTVTAPAGSAGTLFLNDVGTTTVKTVQIDPTDSTVTVS